MGTGRDWPKEARKRMTESLSKAFEAASGLPGDAQQLLAEQLLDEIEGELLWDETLANNPDELERLAGRALQEFRSGKTLKKGFGLE